MTHGSFSGLAMPTDSSRRQFGFKQYSLHDLRQHCAFDSGGSFYLKPCVHHHILELMLEHLCQTL